MSATAPSEKTSAQNRAKRPMTITSADLRSQA
jgi:hypothetical protein